MELALPLFMFRIFAANVKFAVPFDDLAIAADFFDGAPYLHCDLAFGNWYLRLLLQPAHYSRSVSVGTHLKKHRVAGQHPDIVDLHLAGEMREHFSLNPIDLDPEGQPRQGFDHFSFNRFPFFHHLQEKDLACSRGTGSPM
jgi:hypothetical protein